LRKCGLIILCYGFECLAGSQTFINFKHISKLDMSVDFLKRYKMNVKVVAKVLAVGFEADIGYIVSSTPNDLQYLKHPSRMRDTTESP
jgi:hypothetical protein